MPILMKLKQGEALCEEDVIHILQRKEKLIEEIKESKTRYIEAIRYLDDEISKLDKIRFQTSDAVQVKKKEEELRAEYKKSLSLVCEMESIINHVWFHYQQLPFDSKMALEILYVSHRGWKYICDELHISKSKAISLKKKGIGEIMEKINQ